MAIGHRTRVYRTGTIPWYASAQNTLRRVGRCARWGPRWAQWGPRWGPRWDLAVVGGVLGGLGGVLGGVSMAGT